VTTATGSLETSAWGYGLVEGPRADVDRRVIWVAGAGASSSVRRFSPSGEEVTRIDVPARIVTSLCFGGTDRRDVYIVTADALEKGDLGRDRLPHAGRGSRLRGGAGDGAVGARTPDRRRPWTCTSRSSSRTKCCRDVDRDQAGGQAAHNVTCAPARAGEAG
jgi:hypothetical protein